jgi:hypothetical protein
VSAVKGVPPYYCGNSCTTAKLLLDIAVPVSGFFRKEFLIDNSTRTVRGVANKLIKFTFLLHTYPSYLSISICVIFFNPLNAELNLICRLLILLGDLTFMGTCIVSIFQYIFNKMQRYTVYLYLETALHVSGGTSTHHQERIHLYLQHLVFVTPLLLSAAIVEELETV